MDSDLHRLLINADHPTKGETPPGFDRTSEMKRIHALRPEVERISQRSFEIDEHVQDASFVTDLATFVSTPHRQGGIQTHTVLALRFSAFGGLFTTWSVCPADQNLDAVTIQRLIVATERAGYVYVNADLLECEYTGANPDFASESWWTRFFDYV